MGERPLQEELEALRAEVAQLRQAMALGRLLTWQLDLATGVLTASAAWRELYGIADDEQLTLPFISTFYSPEHRTRLGEVLKNVRLTGAPFELQSTLHRRDGTVRFITSRAEARRDATGAVVGLVGVVIDQTAQFEREAQARRLSTMMEHTQNLVLVLDRAGAIEWVNTGFTKQTGFTLDEVRGKTGEVLQGPGTNAATLAHMRARMHALLPFRVEVLNYSKAGIPYWIDVDVQPMRDDSGVVTHFMAIQTVITERKAAEAAQAALSTELAQTASLLRVVLDATEHAVIATNLEGVITVFNRGAERMTGWAAHEVVGRRTLSLLHVHDEVVAHAQVLSTTFGAPIEPGFRVFVEHANRGGTETREWTYVRKDGSTLPVCITTSGMRGADGVLQGFVGVVNDITALRQAEEGWRSYIERLVKLSKLLPGVVYQFQLFPDGRSCIPWASEGLRDMFGVSPEDVSTDASKVYAATHPDDLDRLVESIQRSALELSPWRCEYRVTHPEDARWLLGTATPERLPDGSVLWHGYISDVTEQKTFENELVRAREEALGASQVKSQFLANMSHEIRTPLNGILGMTQLLLESETSPQQEPLLDAVRVSGQTLLALIHDILDLSKVESGRLELERVPFAPRDVLRRVMQTVSLRAEEKGLHVDVTVDPGVPEFVEGDPTRVFQVLLNLAGNAVKFTDAGTVQVAVSAPRADGLRVEVRDTGVGIATEKLPRLFEAFTQGDGSITRRYGGTGLGLAISRKLAAHMGGSLAVASREGQGSTFTLDLPLREVRASFPPPVEVVVREAPARALRVLVAEDNAINALVVRTLLERDGHEVVHVTTGGAAVDASTQPFDVVLMDMQMPELDGLEATRLIRQRERLQGTHVAICALTANAMKGDIERCRAAGMDDYLAKPIELRALRRALAQLTSAQPVSSQRRASGA